MCESHGWVNQDSCCSTVISHIQSPATSSVQRSLASWSDPPCKSRHLDFFKQRNYSVAKLFHTSGDSPPLMWSIKGHKATEKQPWCRKACSHIPEPPAKHTLPLSIRHNSQMHQVYLILCYRYSNTTCRPKAAVIIQMEKTPGQGGVAGSTKPSPTYQSWVFAQGCAVTFKL